MRLVFTPHSTLENTETLKQPPTSPRLQRGLTNMRLQSIKKKSAFMRLVFNTHSTLENTETLKQPP